MGTGGKGNSLPNQINEKLFMQAIIPAIDKKLLNSELTQERFLRYTNNGNNLVFLIDFHNAPHVMNEIGRLREITFRAAGGGTGMPLDLDYNDTCEKCYQQLIVWNEEDQEIVAGYRLINCKDAFSEDNSQPELSTAHLFSFSKNFIENYLPYTLELGRSFVQPKYQPSVDNRKGLFSLDNLWDGLGAVVMLHPEVKYLFGKVTMYPHFQREARDLILYFMNHYFPDDENLTRPYEHLRLSYETDVTKWKETFQNLSYKDGYKILNTTIRSYGENIPPLINTYMNLSPTMKNFGTALNNEFGAVEETGILITIADIYESKKQRHMDTFERDRTFGSR
jgi:hypothetical protein